MRYKETIEAIEKTEDINTLLDIQLKVIIEQDDTCHKENKEIQVMIYNKLFQLSGGNILYKL